MAHIAIIGPGAVGCTLLAALAQPAAHRVIACVRTAFADVLVETPNGTLAAAPRVITTPAAAPAVDWVLVTTKAYDVEGAARWLKYLVAPHTRVAILQNGVEHIERFAPHVPRATLVPVVVDCPAERVAPGRVRQRGRALLTVPDSEIGRAFVALFADTAIVATTTPDWTTVAWRKLALNAAGAVSAIALQPARLAHDPAIAALMRGIVAEVVAVGTTLGARLDPSLAEVVIDSYRNAPPDSINSLHADRLAGRPMETDARNGVVVRLGRLHGVPTPYNESVVALLGAVAPTRAGS